MIKSIIRLGLVPTTLSPEREFHGTHASRLGDGPVWLVHSLELSIVTHMSTLPESFLFASSPPRQLLADLFALQHKALGLDNVEEQPTDQGGIAGIGHFQAGSEPRAGRKEGKLVSFARQNQSDHIIMIIYGRAPRKSPKTRRHTK
jgi:hypothetical protein